MQEYAKCKKCGREIREGSNLIDGTRFYIWDGYLYHEKCLNIKEHPDASFYVLGDIHL